MTHEAGTSSRVALDASTTWLLIVSVDQYTSEANLPLLESPVLDAEAIISWARSVGVPRGNILAHVAEASPRRLEFAAQSGLEPKPATHGAISDSVRLCQKVESDRGRRLLVFLMGHGYMLLDSPHRVFLPQEYTPENSILVDVSDLADRLKWCRGFDDIVILYDACSTAPFAPKARQDLAASPLHAPRRDSAVRRSNRVSVCYASGQMTAAKEDLTKDADEGPRRSLFIGALLDLLAGVDPKWEDLAGYEESPEASYVVFDLARAVSAYIQPALELDQQPVMEADTSRAVGLFRFDVWSRTSAEFKDWVRYQDLQRTVVPAAHERRDYVALVRSFHHQADRARDIATQLGGLLPDPLRNQILRPITLDLGRMAVPVAEGYLSLASMRDRQTGPARRGLDQIVRGSQAFKSRAPGEAEPIQKVRRRLDRLVEAARVVRRWSESQFADAATAAVKRLLFARTAAVGQFIELMQLWVSVTDTPLLCSKLESMTAITAEVLPKHGTSAGPERFNLAELLGQDEELEEILEYLTEYRACVQRGEKPDAGELDRQLATLARRVSSAIDERLAAAR